MIPQKKANLMKTTVVSLVGVVPCVNRNVTSLEDTDLLPDFSGNLSFVLFVKNLCGKSSEATLMSKFCLPVIWLL